MFPENPHSEPHPIFDELAEAERQKQAQQHEEQQRALSQQPPRPVPKDMLAQNNEAPGHIANRGDFDQPDDE